MDRVDSPASDIPIMRFLISTLVSNVPFALPPFFFFFCRSDSDFLLLFLDDSLFCWGSQDDWLFSLELQELSDTMFAFVCSGLDMLECKLCCWIWCSTGNCCWSRLWWWVFWIFCWCDWSCNRDCSCTCCWVCWAWCCCCSCCVCSSCSCCCCGKECSWDIGCPYEKYIWIVFDTQSTFLYIIYITITFF